MTLLRSRLVMVAFFLLLAYTVTSFVVPTKGLIDFTTTLLIAVSIAVVASYVPFLWKSARRDDVSQTAHLVVGITASWAHTAALIGWLVIWREGGQPVAMVNNPYVAFWLFIGVCAGVAHLTAPRVLENGQVPRSAWLLIGSVIGLGVFAALVIVQHWADPGWLAHWVVR